MSCYLVVNAKITDQDKVNEYMAAAAGTLGGHAPKLLVLTTDIEVLEGTPAGERTVIMEFADRAALHAWYDSPAYEEAKKLRLAGTDGFAFVVDSF